MTNRRDAEKGHISTRYFGSSGAAYFEYQNQGGIRRGIINARKFQRFIQTESVVLDFGCGNGSMLMALRCGRRIGIEVNPAAKSAVPRGVDLYESISDVADDSVDVIVSNHVLEHVLCPIETLRQLQPKLRKSGKLILCQPINDWRKERWTGKPNPDGHLYTWTPLLLGNALQEAGFKPERIWIYNHAWPPHTRVWQFCDAHLPVWAFDLICYATSFIFRARQIMAIAPPIS